ncbi:MAG: hypothetical protein Q9M11_05035 [Mariprofundaceae bacterium]|nr:hypothetical protein [Mariprofundaceae bacterium]
MLVINLQLDYLLLEDIGDNRCYEPWLSKITPRLESLLLKVPHPINNRTKALLLDSRWKNLIAGWVQTYLTALGLSDSITSNIKH